MLVDVTVLLLLYLHGTYSQGEGMCSSFEMRRAAMDNKLASVGCDNYTCGKPMTD